MSEIIIEVQPALDEERTKLMTLENEIVNYFHHLAVCNDANLQIKQFPSQVKRFMKEWNVYSLSMGQLWVLKEKNIPEDEARIKDLQDFVEGKEKELRVYFYREEILGT